MKYTLRVALILLSSQAMVSTATASQCDSYFSVSASRTTSRSVQARRFWRRHDIPIESQLDNLRIKLDVIKNIKLHRAALGEQKRVTQAMRAEVLVSATVLFKKIWDGHEMFRTTENSDVKNYLPIFEDILKSTHNALATEYFTEATKNESVGRDTMESVRKDFWTAFGKFNEAYRAQFDKSVDYEALGPSQFRFIKD